MNNCQLPDKTSDHEALLEATAAHETQDVSLTDETQGLLTDEPNQLDKKLPDATDTTDPSNNQLPDETLNLLPDGMQPNSSTLPDKTASTKYQTCSHIELPDTMENLSLHETDDDTTGQNKTSTDNTDHGSFLLEKPDNMTIETNSLVEQEKTESGSTLPVSESDVTAQPSQNEETLRVTTTPSPLPELETSKELADTTETTTEQIIREISYMEPSDDLHSDKSSKHEVASNFKPVETSSVVLELPEFSHTLDTTLTNNTNGSSGSSPHQGTSLLDNNNNNTTDSSGSSRTKWRRLKTCIIRLTELSNQEWEQWMSGSSQTTSTPSLTSSSNDESSTGTNDSRYNMRARHRTPVTRSTEKEKGYG